MATTTKNDVSLEIQGEQLVLVNVTSEGVPYEPRPVEPQPGPKFTLVYTYGWDEAANEPYAGGQTLESCDTLQDALAARWTYQQGKWAALRRMYGEGFLVIVRRSGIPFLAEKGMPVTCCEPTPAEEAVMKEFVLTVG